MKDDNLLLDRYFSELLNCGDFSVAAEILAPGFVFYGPSSTGGIDSHGFAQFVSEMRAGFSDKQFIELDRVIEGHRSAIRFRMTGTQDGWFNGLPPTGARIDVEGCDFIRIHDGRITEVRAYFDLMAIIQRLLIPPPIRKVGELIENLVNVGKRQFRGE